MSTFKKVSVTALMMVMSLSASATSVAIPSQPDMKSAALIDEFEAKPTPTGIDGIYLAGYLREDGSGEFGELWAHIDADTKKMAFIANIRHADESRWGKSTHALAMGGDYYFDGSVLKVRNAYGDTSLLKGEGAAISMVDKDHFRLYYYDRDGKRQVLDYIKQ